MTRYNEDGSVVDSQSYRETLRGGVPVVEKIKEQVEDQEGTASTGSGDHGGVCGEQASTDIFYRDSMYAAIGRPPKSLPQSRTSRRAQQRKSPQLSATLRLICNLEMADVPGAISTPSRPPKSLPQSRTSRRAQQRKSPQLSATLRLICNLEMADVPGAISTPSCGTRKCSTNSLRNVIAVEAVRVTSDSWILLVLVNGGDLQRRTRQPISVHCKVPGWFISHTWPHTQVAQRCSCQSSAPRDLWALLTRVLR